MSSYQKKYISLKDAAIISGYTVAELRNFTKIGLVPSVKRGRAVYIRFDAFEKINESRKVTSVAAKPAKKQASTRAVAAPGPLQLMPFTTPHPILQKVLAPTAFTATLMMVLYLTMQIPVAEKILLGLDISAQTVVYMGSVTESAVATTLSLPETLSSQIAIALTTPDYSTNLIQLAPRVAGASTQVLHATRFATPPIPESDGLNALETVLVGIADASDSFERAIEQFTVSNQQAMIGALSFDNLDPFVTSTFRW